MTTKEVKVNLVNGLHARPASKFVQMAKKFKSKITITYKGKSADPKSIIGLLSLSVIRDSEVVISADGEDETQAVSTLCSYVQEEE